MTPQHSRYATSAALRAALEERLRGRARDTGVPLDRLRKEVAYQRLLARLVATAPEGTWLLKGGQVMIARLDEAARATKDADTTWRGPIDQFRRVIEAAAETDLADGFTFEIAVPKTLAGEAEEGGLRYPVSALLDGRAFEQLQLDVNIVPGDSRPTERLRLRDVLGFAGIQSPEVPVIPPAQHLAEKLHAYTRAYASGQSSRPQDLFDMLAIARSIPLPDANAVTVAGRETFALRHTDWPPTLATPPSNWAPQWSAYVIDHALPWVDLAAAFRALREFWQPVFDSEMPASALWQPRTWRWTS